MVFSDCPICLEEMDRADSAHPLQCSNFCGFNFCKNCIQSFLSSSQDDYMEASDGSKQVKVWLHCPGCRSDLTYSIRDTLLLRKVESLHDKVKQIKAGSSIELTESEKRLQEALHSGKEIQDAVADSRKRELAFFGDNFPLEEKKNGEDGDDELSDEDEDDCSWSMSSYVEEWGVEADLTSGIHTSFRCPRSPVAREPMSQRLTPLLVEKSQTDKTLFYGLDLFLPDDDRQYLTELMVSGNPASLAEAAEILAQVAHSLREAPTDHARSFVPESKKQTQKQRYHKSSSIFGLIAENNAAHVKEEQEQTEKLQQQAAFLQQASTPTASNQRAASRRKFQRQRRESVMMMAQDQRAFPLPVRLPKFMECCPEVAKEHLPLLEDEWDGTVLDAFSKISIGFQNRIQQYPSSHKGVSKILGGTEARIELPGQPRALLASVHREIGQQGATKGDVLTHIQGESVSGKTVEEIQQLLNAMTPNAHGKVALVFNAERSVAEGLRRRAMAKAESSQ